MVAVGPGTGSVVPTLPFASSLVRRRPRVGAGMGAAEGARVGAGARRT